MSSEIKFIKIKDCEVTFEYPSADEVKKCLKNNADLLGTVTVTRGEDSISALVPLPFEGVFVFRSFEHGHADLMVWSAFLVADLEVSSKHTKKDDPKPRMKPSGKVLYGYHNFLMEVIGRRIEEATGDFLQLNLEGLVPIRILKQRGLLNVIRPQNPLELLSGINAVRRFNVTRHVASMYGAGNRLNIPEFDGRICPIETPESEMVGIQLQLARGAKVEADGAITPVRSSATLIDKLGWGASLIPFVNFNDSARNTIGAKNLRQALVLEGREAPLVKTGSEKALVRRMKPLMEVGACPNAVDANGELALGCNLLVAYMPWFGWNIEDAIVVSESTAKKMSAHDRQGELLPLKLGDKLTGRHGNKGVVSKIEPDDQMPKIVLADGREVFADIILNPHGIISRMNPGQLLETHLGWLFKEGVRSTQVMADGGPNHGRIRKLLKEHGLDDRGRAKVILPDGTSTENPVVVGYQYFVRLNHIPSDKSHADRTQRLGEMEVWALAAHEAYGLLKEKLGTGFEPMLKDWLLPLGIGLEHECGAVGFRHLDDDALVEAMTVKDCLGNELTPKVVSAKADVAGCEETFVAAYGCKRPGCGYRVDGVRGDGTKKTLKLGMLLRGLGIFGSPEVELEEKVGNSSGKKTYYASCRLWDGRKFHGYYCDRKASTRDLEYRDFTVSCPQHKSQALQRFGELEELKMLPQTGGLFDPEIFGDDRWGYIKLDSEVNGHKIVPVLPVKYRKAMVEGKMDDLSDAYLDVLRARDRGNPDWAVKRLQRVIKERLFGITHTGRCNTERENSKHGLLRRQGLGREVDHAARQVIVPNPELKWNEVGVPASVYKALTGEVLQYDTDVLVMNRQPTLHKYGMQAFRPRIMEGDEHVFQISPLVCGGFAADFDGDEMVAHCPRSDAGKKDADKLLPENNLVSSATGKPLAHFKLDFKTGAYLLGKGEKEIKDISEKPKSAVKKMSDFAREAFEKVTRNGASFGFYDFLDRREDKAKSEALKLIFDDARANGKESQMAAILNDLVDGMDWKRLFEQANDGRARLCVKKLNSAKAGGLTRRLVLALWPTLGVEGLQAAQAIGERGLQLTQSAAMNGAFDINLARKVFLKRGSKLDRGQLPPEYRELLPSVFDSWDKVMAVKEDSAGSVSPMTRLAAGKNQLEIIEEMANSGESVRLDSPFGKVFFNEF